MSRHALHLWACDCLAFWRHDHDPAWLDLARRLLRLAQMARQEAAKGTESLHTGNEIPIISTPHRGTT